MKDPAALVYIDKWAAATKGMRGAEKGWYFDLILHQFDKGFIPNDLDEIFSICSVRPSEYDLFKHVFEQVLSKKFEHDESGNLKNGIAAEIIQRRQNFKDKKSNAGKISYIMRFARENYGVSIDQEKFLKLNIDLDFDLKNEHVLRHMLEQKLELYINVDVNKDIKGNKGKEGMGEKPLKPKSLIPEFEEFLQYALSHQPLLDEDSLNLKYQAWMENGWKNGHNKEIKNWKSAVLNTIPHLKLKNVTPAGSQSANMIGRQSEQTIKNNIQKFMGNG